MPVRVTRATTSCMKVDCISTYERNGGKRNWKAWWGPYRWSYRRPKWWAWQDPARQEYSDERSAHIEPTVSVHGTEQTQVEEQPFTFEPEVRAAIAREFTELMKTSLPGLLAEALKKVNGECGSNTATGAQNNETDNAPPARGCDYKSFKACDPPVLTGKKDAVATFDWVIRMEAAIRLSECRMDQVVKFAANS
ncbi:hypothetical protein L1987_39800 [Smallanthus sonchifolius]|uniref:Uncharacterized protein n=1 Tax=Smallanthus sonchifolius TaxID=185202 RepID=A0ACB9HMD0_9ASTR|nr:hypothetical protein L1987_39800 [Smallanthus sonchifolius]